jgi:hypothetical protein
VATTPVANAQSSSAAVTGTVSDSTGAKIAGAKVVLKNVDTNVERVTVSTDAGDYNFANVQPARYKLIISAPQFRTETVAPFEVSVAQSVQLNETLNPGDVNTSVTVDAVATQVEASTAQLGTVIGTKQVNDLPLNGRNFTQLLQLTPGATPISTGQNASASNTANYSGDAVEFPSVNGQTNRSTLYEVDGIIDNNSHYNTYAVPPIIDTVQEFKINSHNDAQYGQVNGGVVNIVTKSGTNSLHGTVWEFNRNDAFDASPYFSSAHTAYHINQFGGQVGGPVMIPFLYNGKDKTFFELGVESFHQSQSSQKFFLQPTAAQLGESRWGGPQDLQYADFSPASTGCSQGSGALTTSKCQLYDPTGSNTANSNKPAYQNNQIPVSELDPRAVAFVNAVFGPPVVVPGFAPTVYNGEILRPSRSTTYNYLARIDQHLGTKDFLFFKYAGWQQDSNGSSNIPHLSSNSTLPAQQYGGSWTHVFTPTLLVQVEYGRTHVEYDTFAKFDIPNIATGIYGMDPSYSQSFVGGVTLMPNLSVSGGFSGGETNSPSPNEANIHEYSGYISKTFGKHTFQAGGGWDQINFSELIRQGTITFSGAATANFAHNPGSLALAGQETSQSGNGLADFLLDQPNSANKRNVNITERIGGIASAYVQDSWRLTPKLTMNYGLRYDRTVWPQYGTEGSVGGQGSIETGDFNFTTGNYILQQAPPTCAVRGHAPCLPSGTLPDHVVVALNKKIIHGSKLNFGPRFGLAYRVNDTMSVRAGFGITYDNWAAVTQEAQNYQGSWPDIGTLAVSSLNTPGTANYTSAQNPFGTSSGIFPAATPFGSSNSNYFVSPYTKNPYSEQYNVGIEQQLGRDTIAEINYVGSETHRTDLGGYYNTGTLSTTSFATRQAQYKANPGIYSNGPGNNPTGQLFPYTIPVKYDRSGGNATYNALQASLTRRAGSGLVYNASYTWSKSIDEGDSEWFGAGGNSLTGASLEDPYNPRGSRGPSSYNIPNLLTVGLTYEVPFGRGRSHLTGNSVAGYVLGNWELGTIFVFRSGQNFTVTSAGDIGNTGNGSTYERANIVGNPYSPGVVAGNPGCVPLAGPTRTRAQWFNRCAYTTPAAGTLGDSGRDSLQGPVYDQLDASLFRNFPLWENLHLTLRLDAFNALNHPIMGLPAGASTTTPANEGVITSTANSQRLLQLAAKIIF